jgi:periplasmic protein TonB
MRRTDYRLFLTLTLSLLLHLLPLLPFTRQVEPPSISPAPLQAELRPAPRPAQPQLEIDPVSQPAPEQTVEKRKPQAPPLPPSTSRPARTWTQAIRQHIEKLQKEGNFYPAEAISQGLEGEALILLIINESGNVVAARIEQGSGHRLLDDAALRAVRSVRSLPADAPIETILPVRFRLH